MQIELADEFLTGHETIDSYNLELLNKANQLIAALKLGEGDAEVGELMDYLQTSITAHFEEEEKLQEAVSYPDYENHKAEHQEFIYEFKKIKEQYELEGANFAISIELMNMIINWLADHVIEKDKHFVESLKISA